MRWFISINQFPEVQALSERDRRALLSSTKVPSPLRILGYAFARGLIFSLILYIPIRMFLGWINPDALDGGLISALFGIMTVGVIAFLHFWTMTRYRGQIRIQIRESSRGSQVPVCLNCGQDTGGIASAHCPECGKTIRFVGD